MRYFLKKYVNRNVCIIFIYVAGISLLLGLITLYTIQKVSLNTIQKNANSLLLARTREIAAQVEDMIWQADAVAVSMARDEDVFLLSLNLDNTEQKRLNRIFDIQDRLDNLFTMNAETLHSIYYFFPESNKVLFRNGYCVNVYEDVDYIEKSSVSFGCPVLTSNVIDSSVIHMIEYQQSNEVIKIVRPINYGGSGNAYVVVNLLQKAIEERISDLLRYENSVWSLTDSGGEIALGNGEAQNFDSLEWVICSEEIEDLDLTFFCAVPIRNINTGYEELSSTSALFTWIIIALSIGLGIPVAMKLWQPMQLLYDSVTRRLDEEESLWPKDRIKVMSMAFENLETDNELFQKQLKEYEPKIREYLLTQLLFGQSRESHVQKALEEYGIRFAEPDFQLLVFEMKNLKNDSKGYLQMEIVKNYLGDLEGNRIHVDVLQVRFLCLAVIVNFSKEHVSVQELMHQISKAAEELRTMIGCELTVGMGSLVSEPESLHREYIRIIEALSYSDILGKNTIIHADAISHIMLTDVVYPFEAEERLVNAIQSGNPEAVTVQYEEISENVFRICKDAIMLRQIQMRLLGTVQSIYVGIAGEESAETIENPIPHPGEALGSRILEISIAAANCYRDRWEMKNLLILREAIGYIKEHYAEEITVDDIASVAHTSVSYLYSVFKEANEIAPMQYLNQCRIKKAAERLEKTDEKIKDIAVQCGFFSIQTFNRQFGKQMGASPKEYRISRQHQSIKEEE